MFETIDDDDYNYGYYIITITYQSTETTDISRHNASEAMTALQRISSSILLVTSLTRSASHAMRRPHTTRRIRRLFNHAATERATIHGPHIAAHRRTVDCCGCGQ